MNNVTSPKSQLPMPVVDHDSAQFWRGCQLHKLLLQRCDSCDSFRYPPQPVCQGCGSLTASWVEASGKGRVYSWTIAHHPVHPALVDRVPYNIVMVELAEGPRMVSNLVGVPNAALRPSLPVAVDFTEFRDDIVLPVFRVDGSADA
jgi:uncharacterized OB-fold protein